MSARPFLAAALIAFSAKQSSALSKAEPTALELYGERAEYQILRDGLNVGRQIMTFTDKDGQLEVTADMSLQVQLLWITVYEFSYLSQEIWSDGRLTELDAIQVENGTETTVRGQWNGQGFAFQGPDTSGQSNGPIYATNHWNADVLDQSQVLNTLTGSLNQVAIEAAGREKVKTESGMILATKYQYSGDLQTEVWYDDDGRWVKMRFKAEDGSTITYECLKCQGAQS